MPIKGYLCANRTLTYNKMCLGWGREAVFCLVTSRSLVRIKSRSKSWPVFLEGWFLNRKAFMVSSVLPLVGQTFPLKPPALAGYSAPLSLLCCARPAPDLAHGQLAHGAGLEPRAGLLCSKGNSGHTLQACAFISAQAWFRKPGVH